MKIYGLNDKTVVEGIDNFSLSDIFECGQCFRFNKSGDAYEGVAFGKYLRAYQGGGKIYFETGLDDFNSTWRGFFDIDRDYRQIFEFLRRDKILARASDFCPGLRILKQEPFECLISFIISQNNNIPRIKKIIESLCENFGDRINDNNIYAFPSAEKLAGLSLEDLACIKSGFRAKYILDAARKVSAGEIDLGSGLDAEYLKRIRGVGDKVAACVLLFAYNRLDSFPVDVWIKKVLEKYYPGGWDFGEYAGVANAYLFYWERKNN